MTILPKKVGPFTLMRKLGSDGVTESFVGILDEPAGKQVVVRQMLPWVARDPGRLQQVESRVQDLTAIRHPVLVPVLEEVPVGEDRFVVEEWVDAVDLDRVVQWCRENQRTLPHNIYLNLATQVCNGLEALHGRPGKASGAENVLHHALQPSAILLTAEGKLLVGNYGLVRSPTSLPHGGAGTPTTARMEYLSPEQTHPDQKLTPASDIFSLGSVLYELLTLEPLFRAESNLQTIHRVRRAEVTTPLLRVKEMLPGLDKVLYRALSLNPRHRYQRAFVLREDLRGLMSGFSFARISDETREFLAPLFEARRARGTADPQPSAPADDSTAGFLASLREPSGRTPPPAPTAGSSTGPDDTAALIRKAQSQAEKKAGPSTIVPVPEPDGPPSITDAPEQTSWEHNPLERTAWERNAVPRTDAVPPAMPSITDAPPPRRTAVQGGTPMQSAPPAPAAPPAAPPKPKFEEPHTTWTSAPAAGDKAPSPMSLPPTPAMREKLEQEAKRPTPAPAERRPTPPAPAPAAEKKAEAPPKYSTPGPSPRPNEFDDEVATNRAAPGSTGTPAPAPAARKSLADAAPPPRATPVPPPPVTTAADDDLDFDAPPQGGSRTWMFVAGGVAVVALLACVGIVGTGGVASVLYSKEATTSAIAPATPTAPSTPATTAPASDATSTPATTATPPSGTTSAAPATSPATTAVTTTSTSPTTSASAPSTSSGTTSAPTTSSGMTSSSTPSSGTTSSGATSTPRTTTSSSSSSSSPSTSSGSTSSASSTSSRPSSGTSTSSSPSVAFSDAGTSSSSTSARPTSSTSSKTSTSSSTGSSVDVGFSTPSTSRTTSSSSTATAASTPKTSPSTSKTAAIAAFDLAPPDVPTSDGGDLGLGLPAGPGNLDDYTDKAHRGALSDADRDALGGVASTDPTWSRSRVLLYEDAKARKDGRAQKQYLDDLMSVPENQYNPTLLVEQAEMAIQRKDYKTAVDRATKAEQYWARLPSDLVFSRKAMIYEIEAAGWQGIFYDSGGENTEALDNAVRCWEKYQRHVETKQRQDLMQKADEELAKLYDMQKRLE